ncbi:hypothetical protein BCV69DRAFT_78379 [Microstroma glucosiphilum]|uniref:Uncharacterized protein n=1 Tax=Pseudomicrostroma glucosiphilum TaxID=1684307 RepID=A0A316U154_9BASI|nr:hypothetical protein BCV69DRAFT_78379 [Pseudomicrostroma glucosiphilum]PWN18203.1 hypothetical protein BCV69DRAFT_78379 [Pseudomicrostroma glucosiphilum]
MSVPESVTLPAVESEDELAQYTAESEPEQEADTLEPLITSASSCDKDGFSAISTRQGDMSPDKEKMGVQSHLNLQPRLDAAEGRTTPQKPHHPETERTLHPLLSDESPDRREAAQLSQNQRNITLSSSDPLVQSSEPTTGSLFRGQDDDSEDDEQDSFHPTLQIHDTPGASDSKSISMSSPKEEMSLHTYGPSSFTPKRRLFVNTVSRKYGKIRGVEDDECDDSPEDVRARARLATSPPTPTSPVIGSARTTFGDASQRSSSPSEQVVARRLPVNEDKLPNTGKSEQVRKHYPPGSEFEMTGQRRVGLGDGHASPSASPSRKLCVATRGMDLNEAIEISSTSEADADSTSDSEDCVECDAEGNVLLRTPAVIADEIERRALAGMARVAEAQRTPTKSRSRGKQSPVKFERRSPHSASKSRKLMYNSSQSTSEIKKRYNSSSSDEGMFRDADDADDKSRLAGPSTPSKRRRRPHEGPKRVLPEWQQWEDLLITHEASAGKLGSAGHILVKINEKRETQGLELREAQDVRNRWAKLKATMQVSVHLRQRAAYVNERVGQKYESLKSVLCVWFSASLPCSPFCRVVSSPCTEAPETL